MQYILIFLLIVVAGLVIYLIMLQRGAKNPADLESALLQTLLQQMNQHQNVQQNSNSQIHSRVAETSKAVYELQNKLAALAESNKHILEMSKDMKDLQNILQAPKLRGEIGEMWLEELLAQMIPRSHVKMQYRFKSGEICDAIILLRDNLLLPIDSKFSLENFKKMINTENTEEQKAHEKTFCADIKKRIDEIAKKYILPSEGTLNFAFMYIPAENVYYQAFVEDKSGNNLQRYAFDKHVIPVSPNSLYPYLEIVLFGLRGLEIEKSAHTIQQSLSGIAKELGKFEEDYRKVGTHLRNAQGSFEQSDKRLSGVQNKIETITQSEIGTESLPPLNTLNE